MTNKVFIKELRLYAYHGVLPQEQKVGAYYTLNLEFETNFSDAMETDDLHNTVNYAEVLEIIKGEMAQPSKLLEHVGGRIVKTLFSTFPDVKRIKLQLIKENPPMGAECKGAGIEIEDFRQ
jgi:dihydroneopterin aldolase